MSVVRNLAGFTSADSMNPAKVAEAFARMPAGLITTVHRKSRLESLTYNPAGETHGHDGHYRGYMRKPGQRGDVTIERLDSGLRVRYFYEAVPGPPPVNTPGLIWSVGTYGVVFVTLDGGRYYGQPRTVIRGIVPPKHWPSGVVHPRVMPHDIKKLATAGVLPTDLYSPLKQAREGYTKCARRIWKSYRHAFRRIDMARLSWHTKRARGRYLRTTVRRRVRGSCAAYYRRFERSWHKAMKVYRELRERTLKTVRARLTAIWNAPRKQRPRAAGPLPDASAQRQ